MLTHSELQLVKSFLKTNKFINPYDVSLIFNVKMLDLQCPESIKNLL